MERTNIAVHCTSEELAWKVLALACYPIGFMWRGGTPAFDKSNWSYFKDETCYGFHFDKDYITVSAKRDYEEDGWKVVEADEFIRIFSDDPQKPQQMNLFD